MTRAPVRQAWDVEAMQVPWTESPFFAELLAEADLGEEDERIARDYADNGYGNRFRSRR